MVFEKQLRQSPDPEEGCRAAFGGVLLQGCSELVFFYLHCDLCWWI